MKSLIGTEMPTSICCWNCKKYNEVELPSDPLAFISEEELKTLGLEAIDKACIERGVKVRKKGDIATALSVGTYALHCWGSVSENATRRYYIKSYKVVVVEKKE